MDIESLYKRRVLNDQITLGKLIDGLELLKYKQKDVELEYGCEADIVYDFANFVPTSIDSWRGIYSHLALNIDRYENRLKFTKFLKMLKDSVGETFVGYKGGDYIMSEDTPIWVANCGNSGRTAVLGVVDNDYEIILVTGWREP